jgi:uncharacterized membrane protein
MADVTDKNRPVDATTISKDIEDLRIKFMPKFNHLRRDVKVIGIRLLDYLACAKSSYEIAYMASDERKLDELVTSYKYMSLVSSHAVNLKDSGAISLGLFTEMYKLIGKIMLGISRFQESIKNKLNSNGKH